MLSSVGVYCASSLGADPGYAAAAASLGQLLADRGIRLVYGGAHVGLMGILADAALAGGGEVHGVITQALQAKEIAHQGLTRLEVVTTMHERKAAMARTFATERANARCSRSANRTYRRVGVRSPRPRLSLGVTLPGRYQPGPRLSTRCRLDQPLGEPVGGWPGSRCRAAADGRPVMRRNPCSSHGRPPSGPPGTENTVWSAFDGPGTA